ncbi:hypothetical protein MACK_003004 [Theileria orientalis]|uniref:Peptidase S59 domain-containing protein n=1 Tax=Theileria orientalis TaxID=68886 RepID=A0A976MDZ5_THEOR|nr:hypothetical protein MACK_003004 [Theileria orientalis]
MFFGSNTNQSQQNNINQLNQNTGFNNIANTGYIDPYNAYQQTSSAGVTPFGGFDSNDDFGSYLFNQYGASYLECSMQYNVFDQQSETTSDELDLMYKPFGRDPDSPDDHIHSNTFEDTTIINIAYKNDLSLDEYRWQFYRTHPKDVYVIQREIKRSSGSNDQSSTRTNTTGLNLSQTHNIHTTSDGSSRQGTNTLQSTGFGTTGLTQSNTSLFGQPSTNTGFGQSTTNLFGQSTTTTGFGQPTNSLFGQPTSNTGFGQSSSTLFGQPSNNTGFGQSNTSLFGQTTTNTGFGQPSTIGFGQTNNTTLGQTNTTGFGQSTTNTGFSNPSSSLFGQPTTNTAFGQSGINTGFGQSNVGTTGFGQSSINTGFGQGGSNLFSQPSTNSGFGQTNTSLFGQPSTNTTFTQSNINNTGFGQTNTNTGFGQTTSGLFGQTSTTSAFGQTPTINTGFGQTSINTGLVQPSSNLFGQPSTTTTGLGQTTTMGFTQPSINTGFGQTNINTGFGVPTTTNTSFGQADFTNTTLGQTGLNTGLGQIGVNTGLNQTGFTNTFGQPTNTALGQANTTTGAAQPTVITTSSGQTSIIDSGFLDPSGIKNTSLHKSMPNVSSVYIQPVNVYDGNILQTNIKRYKSGKVSFVGSLCQIESSQLPNTQCATNGTSNRCGAPGTNNGHLGSLNGSGAFTNSVNQLGNSNVSQVLQNPVDAETYLRTKTLAEEVRAELLIFDRHMMEGKFDREREFRRIMRSIDADMYYRTKSASKKLKNRWINDEEEDEVLANGSKSESKKHPNLYLLKPPYGPTPKDFIIQSFKLRAEQEKAEEEKADLEREEQEEMSDPILSYERMCRKGYGEEYEYLEGKMWESARETRRSIIKKAEQIRAERRKEREEAYCNTFEEVFEKADKMLNSDENFLEPDSTWNWDDPLSNLVPKETEDELYYSCDEEDEEEEKQEVEKPEDLPNPNAPKLKGEGYVTRPHINLLKAMTDKELSEVKEFQISRDGYGDILFPGVTDVRGLDLDDIVDIGYRQVSLYGGKTKAPEEGKGLNKRAYVSINNCTPDKDEQTRFTSETSHKFMMKKYTKIIGCNYLGMNFKTGTWLFETPFFVGKADGIVRDGTIRYFDAERNKDLFD